MDHKIITDYQHTLDLAETAQDRLEYLIELGQQLTTNPALTNSPEYQVSGCASNTFVRLKHASTGYHLDCYTDSFIVKGMLQLIKTVVEDETNDQGLKKVISQLRHLGQQYQLSSGTLATRMDAFGRILETVEKQFSTS